jgi:hypothetical protein
MRLSLPIAPLLAYLLLPGCDRPGIDYPMQAIERPGFAIRVPDAKVHHDFDGGATGSLKTEYLLWQTTVDVSWNLSEILTVEEIIGIQDTVRRSYGFGAGSDRPGDPPGRLIQALREQLGLARPWLRVEERQDQRRVHASTNLDRTIWSELSFIQCLDTGVLVTIATFSQHHFHVEAVQRRMLESFQCRPDSEGRLVTHWPVSDLEGGFGIAVGAGSVTLAHADGRFLTISVIGMQVAETLTAQDASGEKAVQTMLDFGLAGFRVQGPATPTRNLTGPAWTTFAHAEDQPVLAVSIFACPEIATAYFVMAADENDRLDAEAVRAFSLRLGCPGAGLRRVTDFPDACAIGLENLCGK